MSKTSPDVAPQQAAMQADPRQIRKVVTASFLGTAMETYDLYLYGTAAALLFGDLFFPNFSAAAGTLLALSTFAVSFVARPLGAMVFGHYGDLIGRKKMLYITLLLMGLSTFAIGLLPTFASIGIAAPLILVLLRFLQGFGFGGEYSGAVLMIAEQAPPSKRGFYAGLNNVGPVVGFIASTGIFLVMSNLMEESAFETWGWRVPFLLSIILVAVGVYLRLQVHESEVFEQAAAVEAEEAKHRLPIVLAVKHYWKEILLASGGSMIVFNIFYLFSVFSLTYATKHLELDRATVLYAVMGAMVVNGIAIPVFSHLSDRIGRKRMYLYGAAAAAIWAFPMFALFDTGNMLLIFLAFSVQMVIYGMVFGPLAAFLGELFGVRVRYTGMAISYNLGGILGAAFAPIIATVLLERFNSSAPIAIYIMLVAAISFVCVLALPETSKLDMSHDLTDDAR